jgi:multidrug efflux pump subunit AcrA (membrane-fusion protein)
MSYNALAKTIALVLAACLALSGCGAIGKSTPAALPTVVLDQASATASSPGGSSTSQTGGGVTASGVVAPGQEAQLASALGGILQSMDVAVGDTVKAGQVLVKLAGGEKLAAAVQSARLELLLAQQELLDAQHARQQLDDTLPQVQTDALQALNDARQGVKDAQSKVAGLRTQASQADLQEAQANLILAKDKLDKAQKDYNQISHANANSVTQAAVLNRLAQAQRDYDNALRRSNNLTGGSTEFYRSQTMAELDIANARLAQAQKDYDAVQNGPRAEDIALADKRVETAQGRIAAAEAAVTAAQAALADLEVKAPFDGTIVKVNLNNGEWVIPGQAILKLADLANLQVETTDLSERDIPQIKLGQAVTVFIKALNQDITGHVSEISPLADTLGGDVVYQTTIELDEHPDGLRPGMSVEVQFGTE